MLAAPSLLLWHSRSTVAVVAVVAIAGVMSGLTLGLLSMDRLDLELMLRTGNQQQERLARRCACVACVCTFSCSWRLGGCECCLVQQRQKWCPAAATHAWHLQRMCAEARALAAFLQVEPHHFSATLGALNAGDLQHWCVAAACMRVALQRWGWGCTQALRTPPRQRPQQQESPVPLSLS